MSGFQQQETHKAYKEIEKYASFKEKSTETVPEKDLMADLLDKDFKTVLKNYRKCEESGKMMCEPNGSNKERENKEKS